MTIERAKRLAEQWSEGRFCSLLRGEAEEYHKMFLSLLCKEQKNNAPLTPDELRKMEGEPVWTVGVSYTKDGTFSMWDIIESVDENGVQFGRSSEHPEWWNYGLKTPDGKLFGWLAYRRKPEEESHG